MPPGPSDNASFDSKIRFAESKTRTHYGRVGSGGARRGAWAGRAWQRGSPTGLFTQDTTVPRGRQGIEENCPEHSIGSTNKNLSSPKPGHTTGGSGRGARRGGGAEQNPGQNPRLTSGSSAVYLRFTTETRSALCSWLLTSGPAHFCPCKPFSCKACPGKSYVNRWGNKTRG